jgi:hypothetical protein
MLGKSWCVYVAVALFGLLAPATVRADDNKDNLKDEKPQAPGPQKAVGDAAKKVAIPDEGKLDAFKGKKLDVKEKGEATFTLSFPGDQDVFIHVTSEKKSDINLYVYDAAKKEIVKDDSPGPECKVAFKLKSPQKLTVVVRNKGPGDNSSTVTAGISKAR